MAYQIIKQPNNYFAVWCTDKQELICYDSTVQELIEFMVHESRARITSSVQKQVKALNEGKTLHKRGTITWHQILKVIRRTEGDEVVEEFIRDLAKTRDPEE